MPGLLQEADRVALKKEFAQLTNTVKLVFFTQSSDCDYCPITQEILEELAALTDKIQLQVVDFAVDKERAEKFKIARIPATALVRVETADGATETVERDYGIRYYGIPAGYEFAALVGDIIDVSAGDSGLSDETKAALKNLTEPIHLQVFSTPT
jgi:glutaredoxin-like protein